MILETWQKLYHPEKPPRNDEPKSWSQKQAYAEATNSDCSRHGGGLYCPDGVSPLVCTGWGFMCSRRLRKKENKLAESASSKR